MDWFSWGRGNKSSRGPEDGGPIVPGSTLPSVASGETIGRRYVVDLVSRYLHTLSTLRHTAAAALLKDKRNHSLGIPWSALLTPLGTLATAEATYYSLSFLESRALKNHMLRGLYSQFLMNLRSFDKATHEMLDTVGEDRNNACAESEDPTFFAAVLKDCHHLAECRLEMVSVYGKLANSVGQPEQYQNIIEIVAKLTERVRNPKSFVHPLTQTMKAYVLHELTILERLLRAQQAISNYQFKDSVFLTFECKTELEKWRTLLAECRQPGGGGSKSNLRKEDSTAQCSIYTWLRDFSHVTASRMLVYFSTIYSQQRGPNGRAFDIRLLSASLRPDFYSVIEGFAQSTEAQSVFIIYEVPRETTPGVQFSREGYVPPSAHKRYKPPEGLNSWPAIFAYPGEPPADHWPNVVSMILDNDTALQQFKVLMYFDKAIDCTYTAVRVDVAYTLMAIHKGKQRTSESNIRNYMSTIADHLRNTFILARLRPK